MISRTLLSLCLLLCCAVAQPAGKKGSWDYFRERDYDHALDSLKQDNKLYPRTAAIIDGMGWCEYFLGHYDAAEKHFRDALAADAGYKWSKQGVEIIAALRKAPLQEAASQLASGQYTDARLAYQRIHDGKTTSGAEARALASAGEGWCLYYLGQYDEAIKRFQRAWKEQTDLIDAQRGIGWSLYARGQYTEALAALRHVLKTEPTDHATRLLAGWALYWRKASAEAEREFRTVTQQAPERAEAWGGLAWSLEQQGKNDAALPQFEAAVKLDSAQFTRELRALALQRPAWNGLAFESALSMLRQKRNTDALNELEALVLRESSNARVHLALSVARLRAGSFDAALAAVNQARTLDARAEITLALQLDNGRTQPTETDCDCAEGWCLLALGKSKDAEKLFLNAAGSNGKVEALLGRGWALLASGAFVAAQSAFEQALAALPQCSDAREGLASVKAWRVAALTAAAQLSWIDAEASLRACDAILVAKDERFPQEEHAQVHILRGQILAFLKRSAEARAAFAAALILKPSSGAALKGQMELTLAEGRVQESISFAAGARKDPLFENDAAVLVVLAQANAADKLTDKARELFEQATSTAANSAAALAAYANFEHEQKHPVEARLLFERAFTLDPSLAAGEATAAVLGLDAEYDKLHGVLGWAWLTRGDLVKARKAFELALLKDAREKEARRGFGITLLRSGLLKEGSEALTKYCAAALPENLRESPWGVVSNMYSEWGWSLYAGAEFSEATRVFGKLSALHLGEKTTYADPFNGLGWCWLRLNKLDSARKAFLEAINISPRHEGALQGLEALQQLQMRSGQ